MNDLIRSSEVAKLIGKNSQTVRKLIRDGILVGQKVNERWYITRDSFDRYRETLPAIQQTPIQAPQPMQPQKQQVENQPAAPSFTPNSIPKLTMVEMTVKDKIKDLRDDDDWWAFENYLSEIRDQGFDLSVQKQMGNGTSERGVNRAVAQWLKLADQSKTGLGDLIEKMLGAGRYNVSIRKGSNVIGQAPELRINTQGQLEEQDIKFSPSFGARSENNSASIVTDLLSGLPAVASLIESMLSGQNDNSGVLLKLIEMQGQMRREDKDEMRELIQSVSASGDSIKQLSALDEFRQKLVEQSRPMTPQIAPNKSPSKWDQIIEIGGKVLEQAFAQHQERLAIQQELLAQAQQAEAVDAKQAEISEMAQATETITVGDYLEDLAKLIQSEAEPTVVLKGVQETLTFAKENNQLEQIKELSENNNDLGMALLSLLDSKTENKEYVSKVMEAAEEFLPLVQPSVGMPLGSETETPNMEVQENG